MNECNLHNPLFTSGLIADYFVSLYGNKWIYNDDKLYFFNGVYWQLDDKKLSELSKFVDKTFYQDLINYANSRLSYFNSLLSGNDVEAVKVTISKITELLKNINRLRKVGNRNDVISDIIKFVSNNRIEFDSNPYLIAFENAIFDLKLNKFVEPLPSHHITLTTGYNYDFNYNSNFESELDEILDTIFPNADVKNYYLTILSTGLCGLQLENCFIATGTGGNGKLFINSLMMKTSGAYAYKLPSQVLLAPIKSGANPEVANMNKTRFILTQELNSNEKICCSTLKEIAGDKTLNVRDLYSSKCSIELTGTTFLECNSIPAVDEVNDAVFRRIRTIPFTSRYVSEEVFNTLEDKTNIFLANALYKTDEFQNTYKQALFNILIKHFQKFQKNNYTLFDSKNNNNNKEQI
jgi:putative DNA primase/helicase